MGNNHSASNRPPPPASASASASGHDAARQHRKDAPRSSIVPIVPIAHAHAHTAQRSVAPETDKTDNKALALPPTAVSSLSASPHSSSSGGGGNDSTGNTRSNTAEPPKSLPVDVPVVERPLPLPLPSSVAEPLLMASNSFSDMYIGRPPRLPLPIEEEVHTPGSPILGSGANADDALAGAGAGAAGGELGDAGESSDLTRKSSALSTNTADDEDSEELRVDKTRPVVPTRLEWRGGGEKVYVTGTIFQWNRKHRLHPVEGQPGVFAATIYILPGTHHVRFLVDGIMQTSPNLPTTVDFGNNLVNYIEVTADEARRDKSAVLPRIGDDGVAAAAAAAVGGAAAVGTGAVSSRTSSHVGEQRSALRGKAVPPPESYRHQLPQYLVDFDQAEESPAYRSAVAAIEKLPTPPSLPGFLGKPILNAATLMKDDNSVLNMPNHTILNHLATSSIKNNVLAVSATTRYHNKYVTTIIYKPTSSDEG